MAPPRQEYPWTGFAKLETGHDLGPGSRIGSPGGACLRQDAEEYDAGQAFQLPNRAARPSRVMFSAISSWGISR